MEIRKEFDAMREILGGQPFRERWWASMKALDRLYLLAAAGYNKPTCKMFEEYRWDDLPARAQGAVLHAAAAASRRFAGQSVEAGR